MSDLNVIPLSETASFIVDNRGKTVPVVDNGIPLIATNCIDNKNLFPVYEKVRFVTQEIYDNWFRSHPKPMDIILTLKGSQNGAVNLVPDPVDFCIAQDMVAIRVDENKINKFYLFAALRSKDVQEQIKSLDVSGVIPHLKKSDFDKLLIPLPDRKTQDYIGEIYFTLSKKIDLLHRQNKTLESMAETLFRQWFIVEAKDDWEYVNLGEVVETSSGGTPSRKNMSFYENGIFNWVKSKELNGLFINDTEEKITEVAIKKSSAKLIPAYSTLVAMYGATVGEFALITKEMTCNQAICAIKPNENFPYPFIFSYIKSIKEELINKAVGSAQQNISQVLIKQMKVPNQIALIKRFSNDTLPVFKKIESNSKQIQTLENLRDTLLPKLMSGEIRVQH